MLFRSGKLVPWRFMVIAGEARARAGAIIASVYAADRPDATEDSIAAERARLMHAAVVIAVVSTATAHPKIPEWEQVLSAGAVCMNLCHAANAMGFGSNWLTNWFGYDRRVLDALGLAPHERMAGFIHIGRSTAPVVDRERPSLDAITCHF